MRLAIRIPRFLRGCPACGAEKWVHKCPRRATPWAAARGVKR